MKLIIPISVALFQLISADDSSSYSSSPSEDVHPCGTLSVTNADCKDHCKWQILNDQEAKLVALNPSSYKCNGRGKCKNGSLLFEPKTGRKYFCNSALAL